MIGHTLKLEELLFAVDQFLNHRDQARTFEQNVERLRRAFTAACAAINVCAACGDEGLCEHCGKCGATKDCDEACECVTCGYCGENRTAYEADGEFCCRDHKADARDDALLAKEGL